MLRDALRGMRVNMKNLGKKWIENKNIVVVGAGSSGQSAARLCQVTGGRVLLLEMNENALTTKDQDFLIRQGISLEFGRHSVKQFQNTEAVILSPGVPKRSIEKFLPQKDIPVLSELELASWFVDKPIIALTGTNGKTTTVGIIHTILEYCGFKSFLGGNIGTPLSDYILQDNRSEVLVLEVSSFQLQNIQSFHPDVAVLLNFSPNHLDYHENIEEYWQAKMNLFLNQDSSDWAIFPEELKKEIEVINWIKAQPIHVKNRQQFNCPSLLGAHNQFNMETAYQACRYFGIGEKEAAQAMTNFKPQNHRLQVISEKEGIVFVDDSKATTVASMEAALNAFDSPIFLLAGGRFKGGDLSRLRDLIKKKVKAVGLFGESREIFQQAWAGCTKMFWEDNLQEVVKKVAKMAQAGEVVLLSPGTSSFDLFRDYKERGQAFQEAVSDL